MFQWKDSFCLPLSHSLKQSDDFELFVSENVAFSPGKKKKKKIQPINLRRVMHLFVFFLLMKMKRQKSCRASSENAETLC